MVTRKAPRSTLVLLVRHGETPTTGKVLPGRAPGLHLSERGRAQADRVAERLAGVRVDAVYTSPLERTRETAAPTSARTGREAVVEPGLLECDFGEWTGEELSRLYRLKAWSTVQRAPSTFRFPGGESFPEMQARTVGAVDRVRAAHEGGVVICFSHADPIKAALAHALGTHLDLFQRIVVSPCSVSAISYPPGQAPAVLTVNSTDEPLAGLRAS
ncbi:MSMEG_4193 family putative phosphomutase [Kocuria rosea]|uniref:MSMEG_4193 family putative phosphomutase n=1 Tax=Kocuria rosea TaxID=1275 RepID=UPI002542289D|nr:MSMEG_4193 family putative phosphomutase [Kocuria rosea]WIG17304.1 MSMEG_4193 family putative phosphomutase [Kocuria rosea]